MSRHRPSRLLAACLLAPAVLVAVPATAQARPAHDHASPNAAQTFTAEQVQAEVDPGEAKALGAEHAEAHARARLGLRAVGEYPQSTRTARLKELTDTQARINAGFDASAFGAFKEYFPSPDFAAHVAMLPTGKVLLFSFERIETNPQKEPAPTDTIGAENAGRAFVWDPAKGTGADAFKKVTPPTVVMPDGLNIARPAPFFCAGHSFLPNGMLGVFGGNLGGNGGSGAKLSLVFDPWTETWAQNQDMATGRWYPSVVTGADGRQLIMSGQSELGWGTPTPIVERFPALSRPVPYAKTDVPRNQPVERFKADAPFTRDYPHLFSLRDGQVYAFGRQAAEQWVFDPVAETRSDLPARPDGTMRNYGSAVPLPGGWEGPNSALILGGDHDDPGTYRFSDGKWTADRARAFGRTQDDTLILPDGTLFTVNGAYDIRDYGNGAYNPNADLKYRQVELRDAEGKWQLGPVQRLPRGYHSNAVVMPDGRIMVTGDELQQLANNPDITSDRNGTIEIYEPAYLHKGPRPALDQVPQQALGYDSRFTVTTSTPDQVQRAVLLSPTTATHAVNTSQRHLELRIKARAGNTLTLQAPPSAAAAVPGWYMLFLLDANGVPSTAQWVQLAPDALRSATALK
ncbi:galactose oxidase early set domain-containing protein [Kitasatospora terrestris]|uniref:Galactose oxidase-like Early set domain-containing protein n=1 Tax=Kitasatospora terrestris TaxID=258051 RepID=A0ABP9DF02_9ACTN